MKFTVTLVYDSEYGGYVVDVPQLPGCMSQGKTIDQALMNIKEAIGLYLEEEKIDFDTTKHDVITAIVEV